MISLIDKLVSSRPEEILLDLHLLKIRQQNGERIEQPLITLFVGESRLQVKGFLIDLRNEALEKMVVIKVSDSDDVLFFRVQTVYGIRIHDAPAVIPLLIDLVPEDISGMPAVTRLAIKTKRLEQQELLSRYVGSIIITLDEQLPETESERYFIQLFLSDITMSLISISKTELGKQSIASEIKEIVIKRHPEFALTKENNALVCHYPFNKSFTTNRKRLTLTTRVYELL